MNRKMNAVIKFTAAFLFLLAAYLPTLKWMADRWFAPESYYGHGFLIPLISLYVVWQRRRLLKESKLSGEMAGLFLVAGGLLAHIICAALKIYFISGFSFVIVLYGLILFLFGKAIARNLIFPVFFLLAMIPLPLVLVGNLIVRLKLFVAQTAAFILNHFGFPSILDGSVIRMPHSFVAVEAPCSGLRSLIALLTLGVVFAFSMKITYFKKVLLFISSVPIALVSNVMRITILAMVNDLYGEKVAMGAFHELLGLVMFGFAFIALYGVSKVLEPGKNPGGHHEEK